MKWILIRHGLTPGNLERRYLGCRTDESLSSQGITELAAKRYPPVLRVFVSPMKRCSETAAILYPGVPVEVVEDFREYDFGDYENKTFAELNGRADYQMWIDSGGELPVPGGESRTAFAERCVHAFEELLNQNMPEDCAIVAHGGTIMAIMEKYARPAGDYFDFQVRNGDGYILRPDGSFIALNRQKCVHRDSSCRSGRIAFG